MSDLSAPLAKLAGIAKSVRKLLDETQPPGGRRAELFFRPVDVQHYFSGTQQYIDMLRHDRPNLFEDFSKVPTAPSSRMAEKDPATGEPALKFSRAQLQRLARDIERIFEIRANSELVTPKIKNEVKRCVFISHGRAAEWREVQTYIEKDIELKTRELAQEPNLGRTILEKLDSVSDDCDSAVIVMTGDDLDADGQRRARQNVIHEIGFFQGKFGLSKICLMHEEGVDIPSNIHGLVYTPFPKATVSAAFGFLYRELKAMYK